MDSTEKTVAVTRGRGRPKGTGGNSRPDRAEAGKVHTEPGDNTRFLRHTMAVADLPPIDTSDGKQVEMRLNEYFQLCADYDMKPAVSGCAMALGISRSTFNRWCNGSLRAETHSDSVKKAHEMLDNMMENYMMNGKINPVAGIFLMKNNHGYSDQQEVVLTPKNPLGEATDDATLQQKYLESAGATTIDDPD